jgi:WXG100 family type VII secretion target
MATSKVQANYDELATIQSRFTEMADRVAQLTQKVRSDYDRLESGGWIGRGSEAFFAEMQDLIFPSLGRLQNAFEVASQRTAEIANKFHEAEDQASARFRTN